MLSLTVGPYPALERHLARRLSALKSAPARLPDPVTVVVPSRTLIRHLERALALRHGLALANVRFHTYQSLARSILLEAGSPAAAFAEDPLLEEFMLKEAVRAGTVRPELAELVKMPGLLGALLNTIRDLEEARVDPENIPFESLEEEEGEIQQLLEIMPLLGHLDAAIKGRGLISRAGVVREAAARAAGAESVGGLSALIYYGAYDMTQHQLDFLFALSECAPVEVMFPAFASRPGRLHPAYQFAESTLALIGQKAGETNWLEPDDKGPLGRRLPGIFGGEGAASGGAGLPEGVIVWRARDVRAQWDLIAEECWRLIEKENMPPHEIVVVTRSLAGVLSEAAAAFTAAELPWSTRGAIPMSELEAGRALCSLVKVLSGDFSPETVLDAACSPVLGICPKRLPVPEARAESRRLWAGAQPEDWRLLAGRQGAAAGLLEAVQRLSAQAAKFPGRAGFDAYAQLLLEVCEAFMGETGAERERVGSIFEAFVDTVRQLRSLGAALGEVEKDEFFVEALAALERAGIEMFARNGGVEFVDAMDARGVSARCVFLADLAEGVFPRLAREDPFLRDPARQLLNEVLGYKIQLKGRAGLEEERLLFHSLLGGASERLYLVWPAGEAGRLALPSGFLAELLDGFGAALPEIALPAEEPPPQVKEEAWAEYQTSAAWFAEIENGGAAPGRWDGIGFPPPAPGETFRATQLVDLARCPFRGYVPGALGLKEPRGPHSAWEPEAAQIGLAVHAALDDAVGELRGQWAKAGAEKLADAARYHFEQALDKFLPETGRFPAIRAVMLEDWGRLIAELLKADHEWCVERNLAPREREQELAGRIGEEGCHLALKGRTDRIDEGGGSTRLVDYKSHLRRERVPAKPGFVPDFYQLAIYRELLGGAPGAAILSVYHLGRALGGVVPVHAEGEVAAEIGARARGLNAALAAMLEQGRMPPFPRERGKRPGRWKPDCDLCGLSLLCRREHEPTRQRLANGGAWADLEQVLGDGENEERDEPAEL